jgi:hypothetical protein
MKDASVVLTRPERWYDHLEMRVRDEAFARRITDKLAAGPPDAFDVTDLRKTRPEKRLIAIAAAAVEAVLREYGADPNRPPLSPKHVHLIAAEEMAAKIGRQAGGKTHVGHVYLCRNSDLVKFLRILTHELTHRSSFLSLVVVEDRPEAAEGNNAIVMTRRVGLGRAGLPPEREICFDGLDEAVTEILAREARKKLVPRLEGLDAARRDELAEVIYYPGPIMVAAKLIEKVAGEAQDFRGIRTMLVQDYVSGQTRFLDRLAEADAAAYETVRNMSPAHADAVQAAQKLGWPTLAERIARLRSDDGRPKAP